MRLKIILFLALLFNALTWIIITPIWQYPDEQAHFAQVQNIAEKNSRTPQFNTSLEIDFSEVVFDTKRINGNNKFTYNPSHNIDYTETIYGEFEDDIRNLPQETRSILVKQEATENPPLYYTIAAIFYNMTNASSLIERVYVVRTFSVVLYLINALVIYKASSYIFKEDELKRIMLSSAVLFLPMFIHASTGILPDPLTNLLFTSLLAVCINFISYKLNIKHFVLLSVLFLLGIFTRQQIIIFIPIFLFALLLYFVKAKKVKLIAFSVLISLCLFIFFIKYKFLIPEIGYQDFSFPVGELTSFLRWTVAHTYSEVIPWYFGVYKWLSLTLPLFVYQLINRLLILSLIGNIIFVISLVKIKKINYIYLFLTGSAFLYFLIFTFGDFYFYKQYGYSFGIQGRYFFPLIFAHISVFVIGLLKLAAFINRKLESIVAPAILTSVVVFNMYSLYFLVGSFYDTSSLHNFVIEASQYKPEALKGMTIFIIPIIAVFLQVTLCIEYTVKRYINNLK